MIALRQYLDRKRQRQEKLLSIYLTAGYPQPDATLPLLETLVAAGADMIELGIPFSDPLADGPTIQASSQQALTAGMTLRQTLGIVQDFTQAHALPLLLMGYANPFMQFGWQLLIDQAQTAGVAGFIIPDLPLEESQDVYERLEAAGIGLVFLVSPNTPPERVERITQLTNSFIYAVSVTGVTGERDQLPPATSEFLSR
ncbi:tryptophan synthase subunit alpha, partial [candidate division KSB3 bacterium]|nr:tryptophan synthase subunit alpha [candidate division KSB3 bacterium]MBD3325258.1 tryptophan synthase subunit alpha [candidate division KSB3 bacterium]